MSKQVTLTDSELLDELAREIETRGPCLLWNGQGKFPGGPRGLSFGPDRPLRKAIFEMVRPHDKYQSDRGREATNG